FRRRPIMRAGLVDAGSELDKCLVQLSEMVLNLGAPDAGQAEFLAVSREPGLPQGVVRHVPRLIEPTDQAQQGDLLIERLSVALPADLVEAIACRLEVDLLAKGDWVIAHDDAHVLAPIRYRLRLTLDQLGEAYLQQLVVIRCRISAPVGVVGEHPQAAV